MDCFTQAIPFARGTFLGDIGFTLAFVGAMNLLPGFLTDTENAKTNLQPMAKSPEAR